MNSLIKALILGASFLLCPPFNIYAAEIEAKTQPHPNNFLDTVAERAKQKLSCIGESISEPLKLDDLLEKGDPALKLNARLALKSTLEGDLPGLADFLDGFRVHVAVAERDLRLKYLRLYLSLFNPAAILKKYISVSAKDTLDFLAALTIDHASREAVLKSIKERPKQFSKSYIPAIEASCDLSLSEKRMALHFYYRLEALDLLRKKDFSFENYLIVLKDQIQNKLKQVQKLEEDLKNARSEEQKTPLSKELEATKICWNAMAESFVWGIGNCDFSTKKTVEPFRTQNFQFQAFASYLFEIAETGNLAAQDFILKLFVDLKQPSTVKIETQFLNYIRSRYKKPFDSAESLMNYLARNEFSLQKNTPQQKSMSYTGAMRLFYFYQDELDWWEKQKERNPKESEKNTTHYKSLITALAAELESSKQREHRAAYLNISAERNLSNLMRMDITDRARSSYDDLAQKQLPSSLNYMNDLHELADLWKSAYDSFASSRAVEILLEVYTAAFIKRVHTAQHPKCRIKYHEQCRGLSVIGTYVTYPETANPFWKLASAANLMEGQDLSQGLSFIIEQFKVGNKKAEGSIYTILKTINPENSLYFKLALLLHRSGEV